MKYGLGAKESKLDLRDFSYKPDKANWSGGKRYNPEDIEDQLKVGICTSIAVTQQARKVTGVKYSADFLYLLQKKFLDKNWDEGSAVRHGPKAAEKYGLLPEKYWKFTKQSDRKLSYDKYIKKLQAVSDKDIEKLLKKCDKVVNSYASVPINRDMLANAIDESEAGVIVRMLVGKEWWTNPIEPLRYPNEVISGHSITSSNYTGGSFRVANTWGDDWADKGTAYHILKDNPYTEAWIIYYNKTNKHIEKQKNSKSVLKNVKKFIQKKVINKIYS